MITNQRLWKCSLCKKQFETKKYRFEFMASISKFTIGLKHLKEEHNMKPQYFNFFKNKILRWYRDKYQSIDRVTKILLLIFVLLLLFCGFSITINSFHWEFKGIVKIILDMFV
jgi:cellulose synthase/poly-beta-1,6-N-acetylglucosamine synthase-like glycosyltransferase